MKRKSIILRLGSMHMLADGLHKSVKVLRITMHVTMVCQATYLNKCAAKQRGIQVPGPLTITCTLYFSEHSP